MGITYAQGTNPALLNSSGLAERLTGLLRTSMPWLATLSEETSSVPEREGKWSAKQIIGHLTDSAINNIARIVRMQIASGQSFPGYEQREWVSLQHYAQRPWPEVLALWFALNKHVEWTIAHLEEHHLVHTGIVEGDTLTLAYLIEDYIAHMDHHLSAMRLWLP